MIPVIPLSGYTLDISFVRGEAIIVKVYIVCGQTDCDLDNVPTIKECYPSDLFKESMICYLFFPNLF